MDAFDRNILMRFLYWGEDFERSRQGFIDCNHRAFRQWVRQAPEHAQAAIKAARAAAPDGLYAFAAALADHFPVYGEWLAVVDTRGLAG